MKHLCIAFLAVALSGCANSAANDPLPRSFEDDSSGFAMNVPDGWISSSFLTFDGSQANMRLDDAELARVLQQHTSNVLLFATRYPEPHSDINPSIQVTVRPTADFGGASPREVLATMATQMRGVFRRFEVLENPTSMRVSGLRTARIRVNYDFQNGEGAEFPITSRIWLIPRGSVAFMISMSGPQEGPDYSETEFMQAMESVSIRE